MWPMKEASCWASSAKTRRWAWEDNTETVAKTTSPEVAEVLLERLRSLYAEKEAQPALVHSRWGAGATLVE